MIPANQDIIQTQGLSKAFGEVQALKGLDLSVPEHSICGGSRSTNSDWYGLFLYRWKR